jgi:hypothetical protein
MQVETIPPFAATEAEIDYTFSVKFRFNITPLVARQKANVYLLMNVGNMLSAGEPTLLLAGGAYWKIPVWCAYPEFKRREHLGDLIMDTDSGEIDLGRSSFASAAAIEARADAIYHSLAALSTGV